MTGIRSLADPCYLDITQWLNNNGLTTQEAIDVLNRAKFYPTLRHYQSINRDELTNLIYTFDEQLIFFRSSNSNLIIHRATLHIICSLLNLTLPKPDFHNFPAMFPIDCQRTDKLNKFMISLEELPQTFTINLILSVIRLEYSIAVHELSP
jgi:hypothetical protein